MTNVIMHGCNGKMGQVIINLIKDMDGVTVVAGIDKNDSIKNEFPVFTNIKDCDVKADAIIDFATATAMDALIDYAVSTKTPLVTCTTGLTQEQLQKIETASKEVAILKSANMSLGINLLQKLLKEAAGILADAGYDIEIVERHHNQKIDAPSGTAFALADSVNEGLKEPYEYCFDRSQVREKRKKNEIGISAVRGGSIVGEHEVIFAGVDEVIEFKHTAYSKAIFGKGAIEAAVFLAGKPAGMYNMSDVINTRVKNS